MAERSETWRADRVSRRGAVALLGSAGLGLVAAACGGSASPPSSTASSSTAAGSSSTTAGPATAACVLQPEVTEGPYYLDLNKVRADITEGRPGAALDLRLTVVDASGCTPIKDAAVDIWHCDAGGVYSGFGQASTGGGPGAGGTTRATTDARTFLRGVQLTDADGLASFRTIYPGWYRGRAVHIHLKVHIGGNVVHTGQLFFDDDLSDTVFERSPYAAHGTRDTRNDADRIYASSGAAASVLDVTTSGDRYTGSITLGVRQT
jgi:protocatechuate 3,4-dioxygenase beta subunit